MTLLRHKTHAQDGKGKRSRKHGTNRLLAEIEEMRTQRTKCVVNLILSHETKEIFQLPLRRFKSTLALNSRYQLKPCRNVDDASHFLSVQHSFASYCMERLIAINSQTVLTPTSLCRVQ
jgi:hypothetical protein